jgi:hypothetical protein
MHLEASIEASIYPFSASLSDIISDWVHIRKMGRWKMYRKMLVFIPSLPQAVGDATKPELHVRVVSIKNNLARQANNHGGRAPGWVSAQSSCPAPETIFCPPRTVFMECLADRCNGNKMEIFEPRTPGFLKPRFGGRRDLETMMLGLSAQLWELIDHAPSHSEYLSFKLAENHHRQLTGKGLPPTVPCMSVALDALIVALGWLHVLLAPYSKVEESFNLHAMHDVLMFGVTPRALPLVSDLSHRY